MMLQELKKRGYGTEEEIPDDVLAEVAIKFAKMLKKDIITTTKLMSELGE